MSGTLEGAVSRQESDGISHAGYSYVRQKTYEALRCLVSTRVFRDRLAAAASPLLELKNLHRHLVADLRLISGGVLVDQSMLTGESVPAEGGIGFEA